jgi:hypothetical protein
LAQVPVTGSWFSLQLPVNFSHKWQWHNDAGYRTMEYSFSAYQFFYRSGARYYFTKSWSTASGYALFFTSNSNQKSDHEFGKEFRLWQELNAQQPFLKFFSIQNRFRTEQRWFDSVTSKDAFFGLRWRHRAAITKKIAEKWSLQLADEYMQQLAEGVFSFNQNRLQLLAIVKMNHSGQVQAGYMWLKRPQQSQHIVTVSFQKTFFLNAARADK